MFIKRTRWWLFAEHIHMLRCTLWRVNEARDRPRDSKVSVSRDPLANETTTWASVTVRQRANPHELLVFGVAQILIERTVAHLARFTCQIATSTTAAVINKQTMNNNNSELPITATLTIVSALTTAVTVCRNCRASKNCAQKCPQLVTWPGSSDQISSYSITLTDFPEAMTVIMNVDHHYLKMLDNSWESLAYRPTYYAIHILWSIKTGLWSCCNNFVKYIPTVIIISLLERLTNYIRGSNYSANFK